MSAKGDISAELLENETLSDLNNFSIKRLLLAKKIMDNDLSINDLTDYEVEEMIQFFESYIRQTNSKIEKIRQKIIKMRKTIKKG